MSTGEIKRISRCVKAEKNKKGKFVFTNNRGMNINGNRTIHMGNWELRDLKSIVKFLEG
jgi:hypothetical protein